MHIHPARSAARRGLVAAGLVAAALAAPACSWSTPRSPVAGTSRQAPQSATPVQPPEPPAPAPVARVSDPLPATTNISQVTFAQEGGDFDPCVSGDGKTLVYASTQHRSTADIYLKRTDSRVVTRVTNDPADDVMPTLSPDGTRIAFASNRSGNWDVYVMPVSGGKAVQITSDAADELHPSWSPDGRRLVYSKLSPMSARWELWVCDPSNPAIGHFIGYGLLPRWCPVAGTGSEGRDRILFQLGRERGSRAFDIWTIDYADGMSTNATLIASQPGLALINPSWSPDGRWIAFTQVPAAGATPPAGDSLPADASLFMISVDGNTTVRLTGGGASSINPVWASDNHLFFVSDRGGSQNIWSLNLAPALAAAGEQAQGGTSPVAGAPESREGQ